MFIIQHLHKYMQATTHLLNIWKQKIWGGKHLIFEFISVFVFFFFFLFNFLVIWFNSTERITCFWSIKLHGAAKKAKSLRSLSSSEHWERKSRGEGEQREKQKDSTTDFTICGFLKWD